MLSGFLWSKRSSGAASVTTDHHHYYWPQSLHRGLIYYSPVLPAYQVSRDTLCLPPFARQVSSRTQPFVTSCFCRK